MGSRKAWYHWSKYIQSVHLSKVSEQETIYWQLRHKEAVCFSRTHRQYELFRNRLPEQICSSSQCSNWIERILRYLIIIRRNHDKEIENENVKEEEEEKASRWQSDPSLVLDSEFVLARKRRDLPLSKSSFSMSITPSSKVLFSRSDWQKAMMEWKNRFAIFVCSLSPFQ